VRAFDVETGKVLWESSVPAGAEGIPAVYQVNGRQFIVFCVAGQVGTNTHVPFYRAAAGGGNRAGGDVPIPGSYIAFALPEGSAR